MAVSASLGLLTAPACLGPNAKAKSGTKASDDADDDDDKQDKGEGKSGGGLGGLGGPLGPLGMMLGNSLEKPGPYEELEKSEGFSKDAAHFAVLELDGVVTEKATVDPLGGGLFGGGATVELEALQKRLTALAADPNIAGLIVRFGAVSMDIATAEEVRTSFQAFAKGDRVLACHGDDTANTTYLAMTGCETIGIEELGGVTITGAAATPIHLKGTLDKLGISADFVHVGDYKGAAEPLTLDAPSKAMMETLTAIVDDHYQTMAAGVAGGRGLAPDKVTELIDTAVFQGDAAKKAGLVDEMATFQAFRDGVVGDKGWTKVKLKSATKGGGLDIAELQRFIGLLPPDRPSEPHVGLIYALGNIVDGDSGGVLGAREVIAARTLSAAIRAMARDEKVTAIVLRVNSGGGSANASEQIWQALQEAKAKKPVVVSMGRVAASGGYYISAGATKIYALPTTLTGSIGVVGGKLAMRPMTEKIGMKTYAVSKGKRALMWSAMDRWTDDERASVLAMMESVYERFVARVGEGRGKTRDQVHEIAQGRVWTGLDAKERGLVDELGGLEQAVAHARELGGVGADVKLEVYPPEPTLRDLLQSMGGAGMVSAPPSVQLAVQDVAALFGPELARATAGVLGKLMLLRTEPVLTAELFPVLLQ